MQVRNINSKEFARRLGVSYSTFYRWLEADALPRPRRMGHCYYWLEAVADAYLIRAFEHPLPMPELPAPLVGEVERAAEKLWEIYEGQHDDEE